MKKIYGFLQTTRFVKSIAVSLVLGLLTDSVSYGINASLFLLFSFAFNDLIDADKDNVGHPDRAIPSGKITRRESALISLTLLLIGVSIFTLTLSEYLMGFITIYSLSILYSLILKPNLPILATPVWSLAVAILFVQPFSKSILLYVAIASVVYGYENLLDIRDRKSDKQFCRTPTVANMLGDKTYLLAILSFILGVLIFFWSK